MSYDTIKKVPVYNFRGEGINPQYVRKSSQHTNWVSEKVHGYTNCDSINVTEPCCSIFTSFVLLGMHVLSIDLLQAIHIVM